MLVGYQDIHKARISLNFGQFPSLTTELAALEHLKMYFHQVSSESFIQINIILVDNLDI